MIRLACLTLCAAVACGRSQGVADQDLGGLVVEAKKPDAPIDVARAAREPAELGRALMRPHVAALGPHTEQTAQHTTVEEAGAVVSDLSETSTLGTGEAGVFHGEYTNSADYGRETIFVDGKLYLRPRYQRWHQRAPETTDEPQTLRDAYADAVAATWDLVSPAAELTDQGLATVAGRSGKKIAIRLSPSPRQPATEAVAQRKWREHRSIEELTGEVVLDADKGVPLSVKLAATVAYQRDGRRFRMKLSLQSAVTALTAPAITAPAETEVVATPERLREVDDRDYLLQGIAPPIHKNADGTAVTPSPAVMPATGSASPPATPAEKKPDKKSDDKKSDGKKKSDDTKSDDKKDGAG